MRTLCPEVTREQPPALSDKLNGRLDFLGQHKRKPEFPIVTQESRLNSRKILALWEAVENEWEFCTIFATSCEPTVISKLTYKAKNL